MRMPETQPLDFVANNASLWMDRQILDAYGYKDKPITQCYEICYPEHEPRQSLAAHAGGLLRPPRDALAGVGRARSSGPGSITDMGNSYYFSNWGACGFCFAKPDVRPKPSYVAIATMTQQLDGAKFTPRRADRIAGGVCGGVQEAGRRLRDRAVDVARHAAARARCRRRRRPT